MEASNAFAAAIIEHESSARTALQHLLTDIGCSHLLISKDLDHHSLSDPLLHYPLIFVGWQIWDQMKWSMFQSLRKDSIQHTRKVLLFVSKEHPLNLLEAVHLGIDGYITYPFSLHNISQKIRTVLPDVHFENHKAHAQRYSGTQKKPSVSRS